MWGARRKLPLKNVTTHAVVNWLKLVFYYSSEMLRQKSSFDSSLKCNHHWTKPVSRPTLTGSTPPCISLNDKRFGIVFRGRTDPVWSIFFSKALLLVKPEFFRFFFDRLGCLFNYFHFHTFIRSSKYESLHIFPVTPWKYEKCRLEFSSLTL